ncbi:hypothetical protein CIPAW_11G015900 [Carya illinoinensis]|uniref:Uncharacterized protein n=1 Tax=Carya illinoinensis TaxID=32201 RepID=A0A8T1NZJ0_CARIL|nr:hypothetical protein CIPAW_11G015900 [Carya illinoinensis]
MPEGVEVRRILKSSYHCLYQLEGITTLMGSIPFFCLSL